MDDLADKSFDELFGEVRSIVHGPPSADAFARLTEALDAMGPRAVARLDPGYLAPVTKWYPEWRELPTHWSSKAQRGEDVPFIAVCAHVSVDSPESVALLDGPHAHHFRALTVWWPGAGEALSAKLIDEAPLEADRMECLRLRSIEEGASVALRASTCFDGLRAFHIDGNPALLDVDIESGAIVDVWRDTLRWALGKESLEVLRLDGDVDLGEVIQDLRGGQARLAELHIRAGGQVAFDEGQLAELLALPATANLTQLSVTYPNKRFAGRLGDADAETLASAPCAATLERVALTHHGLTGEGVSTLRRLPRLTHLDVTGNDFDPSELEDPSDEETPAEVVTNDCVPEEQRSHLNATTKHTLLQRAWSWRAHIDGEFAGVYVAPVLVSALLHALLIGFVEGHPLWWWVPFAMVPPLFALRWFSWLQLTHVLDWIDLDEGAHPRHEVRQVERRAATSALVILTLHGGLFAIAAKLCVWGAWATPSTGWLEAVWWSAGPLLTLAAFVLALYAYTWASERFLGRPGPLSEIPFAPDDGAIIDLTDLADQPPPRE
jgi:hypothetical protein